MESITIPFLLLLTTLTFLVIILRRPAGGSSSNRRIPPPPPGPRKLPIIGNLHQLLTGTQLHHRLTDLARIHGPDIMHLQLGQLSHVIISTPESAKQVMKTHDLTFASRPSLLATDLFFGGNDIAFAPYGEHWRQLRRICTLELLSAKRVGSFRWIREQAVSDLVADLRAAAGREVDLTRMVEKLSGEVTSRAAFGTIQGLNETFIEVAKSFVDVVAGFRVSDLYPSLTFLPVLTGFKKKLEKMYREADSVLDAILDERRSQRSLRRGDAMDAGEGEGYLLDVLLDLHENPSQLGFPLTMEVVKAVTLELFFAGIDTSATVMEWTMSELIKHPKAMQKAHTEIRELFAEGGNIEEASLHQLKYLDSSIKETLRLHPPGPLLLPRENDKSVQICGYQVPAKTKVFVNVWAINRDPRYWSEPDEFRPERFDDCAIDYRGNDFHFIPFGAGRRICPGYDFGVEIVKLALANLIFHFDWKLPGEVRSEDLDMTERFAAAVGRKYALRVIPIPCHGS